MLGVTGKHVRFTSLQTRYPTTLYSYYNSESTATTVYEGYQYPVLYTVRFLQQSGSALAEARLQASRPTAHSILTTTALPLLRTPPTV